MESDAKEVQPTFNTKPPIEDLKERRDSAASSDGNSSGTDVEANQGGTGFLYVVPSVHINPQNHFQSADSTATFLAYVQG